MTEPPVVVIGAGPIGLAAAAHLTEQGRTPLVLEAGPSAGAAVTEWQHIRLFSPWAQLVDDAASRLLARSGWRHPEPARHPTGAEWVAAYLHPLAAVLGDRVQVGSRVTGVTRRGRDRLATAGREAEPFIVHAATRHGDVRLHASAVIDASGTWATPNPLGADGLPALGEPAVADRVAYRVPDLTDPGIRRRYAGKRVALAGSGHSALTALIALSELAQDHPDTRILWLLRRDTVDAAFRSPISDLLPARGSLEAQASEAVRKERVVEAVTAFRAAAVHTGDTRQLVVESVDGRRLEPVDEIIALTGFRPDLSWLSEVRLDLDPVLQAPGGLATLIDPKVHTCNTVPRHGAAELVQPESGLFIVGMKSYGRAPTFLASTGYAQVRSVVAALNTNAGAAVLPSESEPVASLR